MSENIANRVGRIISGGFNALVDAMENAAPETVETVMEQAIREVDDAVVQVRSELGKQIANKHLASKRIAQEDDKYEELSDKIELALKEGRDDLAEVVISKQLDIEAQIPILEQSLADCSAKEKELEGFILALQAQKKTASTFERVLARQTGLRSVAGSSDSENVAKLAELEDLSRKNRIRERLVDVKSDLGIGKE